MRTTIIIPTYNERENIAQIIPRIHEVLPQVHILVVDDNSPDKTYDVVRNLQRSFPNVSLLVREKKEGLGKAYIHAFKTILKKGEVDAIIMMDADFSHDPKYLPQMIELATHADVVIGSRYTQGGRIDGWDLRRRLLSKFGNMYARTIIGVSIRDYTSGFNMIKVDMLKMLDLDSISASGYAFLMEFKISLWKFGARIMEMPITLYDRTMGESKISGKIIQEGIFMPWKIRAKKNIILEDFDVLDTNRIKNFFIFLDVDGTLVSDGADDISTTSTNIVAKLKAHNEIVLCSNKNDLKRLENIAHKLQISYLETHHKKPSSKILKAVKNRKDFPFLVIGDKFLTDGIFAKRIGARFIKVGRKISKIEKNGIKCIYALDDFIYFLIGRFI